jgi:hypothetical protein
MQSVYGIVCSCLAVRSWVYGVLCAGVAGNNIYLMTARIMME